MSLRPQNGLQYLEGIVQNLQIENKSLVGKVSKYEKALRDILSISEDTPELEAFTKIVKGALKDKPSLTWGKSKERTHCENCNVDLKFENTSPASIERGYCHTCYNDLGNAGLIKF